MLILLINIYQSNESARKFQSLWRE